MSQESITAVVMFFVPLLASLVKQAGWPSSLNAIVAFAVYLVVGVISAVLLTSPLTLDGIVLHSTEAVIIGTAAYHLFWKNVGEDRLTEATSIVR